MKNLFSIITIIALCTLLSCKKEFSKPIGLCDCFTFTKKSFKEIMEFDSRYQSLENENFVKIIDDYLLNYSKMHSLSINVKNNSDNNFEYIHSLLKTNKRDAEDTIVIYTPNFDHADFNKNPILAISDILDDSISGGEDRIWGAYIDEGDNDELKYIILDEDHAMNTARPVFIFDTRFTTNTILLPENGNPVEGGQAQTATGDKYFISYVKALTDLDHDNRMEVRYGHYVWSSFEFQYGLETYDYDNLYIYDNQIGQQVTTWHNIPKKIVQQGGTETAAFPFYYNHFTSMVIYDHDWPASKKKFYLYPPAIYLWPNSPVYQKAEFSLRMTNSSSKLIAWGNITLSDTPNGWYLPVHNCPDGLFGIYHYN